MSLTDADKAFLTATASLDTRRHMVAIATAFHEAYGQGVAGAPNRQIVMALNRLRKRDEAKDFLATVGALATVAVRQVAVRTATAAVENKARREEALEDERAKTEITVERLKQVRLRKAIAWLEGADGESGTAQARLLDSTTRIIVTTVEPPKFNAADDRVELQQLEALNQALKRRPTQEQAVAAQEQAVAELTTKLAEQPNARLPRA